MTWHSADTTPPGSVVYLVCPRKGCGVDEMLLARVLTTTIQNGRERKIEPSWWDGRRMEPVKGTWYQRPEASPVLTVEEALAEADVENEWRTQQLENWRHSMGMMWENLQEALG